MTEVFGGDFWEHKADSLVTVEAENFPRSLRQCVLHNGLVSHIPLDRTIAFICPFTTHAVPAESTGPWMC